MRNSSMRPVRLCLAAVLGTMILAGVAVAQQNADVRITQVRKNIYMLTGAGGNIAVSAGPDGGLIVDSGRVEMSDKIIAAVQRLGRQLMAEASPGNPAPFKPIQFIINTNALPDHTGGNSKIAKAGRTFTGGNVAGDLRGLGEADPEEGAQIYAYQTVLNRMSATLPPSAPGKTPLTATPTTAWPTVTYDGDVLNFSHYFNGEAVQIIHQPAAVTDGDSMVYFRGSDVLAAGDIMLTTTYPNIDLERGGSLQGVIAGLNHILDIAVPEFRLEGGTMIIPGHGRICDSADVAYYRDMVTVLRDRIQDQIRKGKTLAQVKEAGLTKDYDGRYGSPDKFIEAAYKSLSSKAAAK
jgi:cyclase